MGLSTRMNLSTCICKKDVERGVSSWGRRRPGRAADCCPGGARLFPRGPFALSVLPSARTAVSPPQTASPDPAVGLARTWLISQPPAGSGHGETLYTNVPRGRRALLCTAPPASALPASPLGRLTVPSKSGLRALTVCV